MTTTNFNLEVLTKKMRFRILFLVFCVMTFEIFAIQPASVSFLVADLKHSKEHGVKICEIQHGIVSTFYGNHYAHNGYSEITENFFETFSQFQKPIWAIRKDICYSKIRDKAESASQWKLRGNLSHLLNDPEFQKHAQMPVYDPSKIEDYAALLFIKLSYIENPEVFARKYPGILLIDSLTHSCWIDKYEMSVLFENDSLLSSFKPKWGLFPNTYTTSLADSIISQLACDVFVIKPRSEFLGNGVIIVDREHLDETLRYILIKSKKLKKDPDLSYQHWYRETNDTFIVEEFISSDPKVFSHLSEDSFDPTMRVAALVIQDKCETHVTLLGCNWFTPLLSLSQEGTWNQKHKGASEVPYYALVDDEEWEEIQPKLELLFSSLIKKLNK